jgi:hypothetical protein
MTDTAESDLELTTELFKQVNDRRWIDESIAMARAAAEVYDPRQHKLVEFEHDKVGDTGELTYRQFFLQVSNDVSPGVRAPDSLFGRLKNVRTAIEVFRLLTAVDAKG